MADPTCKAPSAASFFPKFHINFTAPDPDWTPPDKHVDVGKAPKEKGQIALAGTYLYVFDVAAEEGHRATEWLTDAEGHAYAPDHVGDCNQLLELAVGAHYYAIHHAHVRLTADEIKRLEALYEKDIEDANAGKAGPPSTGVFLTKPTAADQEAGIALPSCVALSTEVATGKDGVSFRGSDTPVASVFYRGCLEIDNDGAPNAYALVGSYNKLYASAVFARNYDDKGAYKPAGGTGLGTLAGWQKHDETAKDRRARQGAEESNKKKRKAADEKKKKAAEKEYAAAVKKATAAKKPLPPPLTPFVPTPDPPPDPKIAEDEKLLADWDDLGAEHEDKLPLIIVDDEGDVLNRLPAPTSTPLDNLANAVFHGTSSPHWDGIVSDSKGRPVVQSDGPYKDFFISPTSLRYADEDGVGRLSPKHYVDASKVPFISLAPRDALIKLKGDFCVLAHKTSADDADPKVVPVIVAEYGGAKSGEVAKRTAELVGSGSSSKYQFGYVIFKGTALRGKVDGTDDQPRAPPTDTIVPTANDLFKKWGGIPRLRCCFPELFYKKPPKPAKDAKPKK